MRSDRHMGLAAVGLLVALAAAACGGNPAGPDNGGGGKTWTLTVLVKSEQQQAIRNATVKILDGADAAKSATTDDSGSAVLYNLREGAFSIEVTAQEYYPSKASVSLTTSTTLNVAMKERNKAPVISSLIAQGTDPGQPPGMTDVGDTINVTANVSDKETVVGSLTFAWAADVGTISGTGQAVQWRAPSSGSTPFTATINVTITEKFTAPGSTVVEENVTKGEVKVRVHDSPREAGAVARDFLVDFSKQLSPQTVISNYFSTSPRCTVGRTSELSDMIKNQENYEIESYNIGQPDTEIHFDSTSPFRDRPADAWIDIRCSWVSTGINPAIVDEYRKTMVSSGICRLTAIYDVSRWALCFSDYEVPPGTSSAGQPKHFIR